MATEKTPAQELGRRRLIFDKLDAEKIISSQQIVQKDSPQPWTITKTVETIQIQTQDSIWVKSIIKEALSSPEIEFCAPSPLEKEFNERADRWEKETAIYSDPAPMYLHRDYTVIAGRGIENPKLVIPWILKRLESHGGDWFFALEKIADENPAQNCEDFDSAKSAWNKWAKEHGIISKGNALQTA